jgi:quinol monooxygenase YgiN
LSPEEAPANNQQSQENVKHMILATIRMNIPREKHGEALKILRSVAELCKDDPGCLKCHIYGDLQDRKVIMFEEVWGFQEDLDLHLRSDEYRNLLLLLDVALKQPEIKFDTVSNSTGIETIEKARGEAR